ncbi:MAG: sulfatase [Planctomycetota bacterium]|nr:sulfatase [Planctomycetota bacterium]
MQAVFVQRLFFVLSFIVFTTIADFSSAAQTSQPNILLIVSEDNGPELGCYGDKFAKTPRLDKLASEGILFSRAYVPQAGCSQSRASFLTGLYPHQHGQFGLATWGFCLYRKDTPNLPRSLKAVGYRTGIIGKLHINPAEAFPFDFHEIPSANFSRKDISDYAKFAKQFITESNEPFFLSVNYPDAHDPWIRQVDGLPVKPQSGEDVEIMEYMGIKSAEFRAMVADYYNCMSRLDTLIGDLLDVLENSGKSENTIVIYIGDHGADMLRGKRTCYEGGLRIPMMIRWPGKIAPQMRAELVSTLDLAPTLLEATNAEMIANLPGVALQPLFQSGRAEWREHYFAEYHTHAAAPNFFPQRCVRGQRYKLIESLLPDIVHPDYVNTIRKLHGDHERRKSKKPLDLYQVIASAEPTVRAAYELTRRPPRFQLYDLKSDPFEFQNLATDPAYAIVLKDLQSRLNNWRKETNDPLLDPEKLRKLTQEVQSVTKKSIARDHKWKYPVYLGEKKSSANE